MTAKPGDTPDTPSTSEDRGGGKNDWRSLHLWQIQPLRDVLVVAVIFGVLWLGSILSVVTVPLLLALVLAYLFEPVVHWLQKRRRTRRQAAATILGAFVLVIVLPAAAASVLGVVQVAQLASSVADKSSKVVTILEYPGPSSQPGAQQRTVLLKQAGDSRVLTFLGGTSEERRQARKAYTPLPPRWQWLVHEIVELAAGIDERKRAPDAQPDDKPTDSLQQAPQEPTTDPPPPAEAEPNQPAVPGDVSEESPDGEASNDAGNEDHTSEEPDTPVEFLWSGSGEALESSRLALTSRIVQWLQQNSQALAKQALGAGVDAAGAAISFLKSIGMLLFSLFLTCFFFFFLSWRYPEIVETGKAMIPVQHRERTIDLISQMDKVVAGFVRGRLVICFCQSIFFTIAYALIGVPAPLVIGPIVGILSLIPYVSLISIPTTIIAMALDAPTGFQATIWWILLAPIGVYMIGQSLDDYVLTPLIQGKTTNMDTPTILFASLAGGVLAGVYGLLVAIPVAASLKILIREIFWPRYKEWAAGKKRDMLPIDRGD